MPLPPSGQISINQIRTELGTASGSLRTLSSLAGFATPDRMSDFYGYGGTAQLTLFSQLGTAPNSRARWFKNGVLVGTFTYETIQTLNAGDTFYITAVKTSVPSGCNWYLTKNGVSQETGAGTGWTSATYTVSAGDVFDVAVYGGL
jgi:hypothetical protein